ncbi:MAG: WbqC family protein [Bacteroidales bacterium]|nr:WbqC family protein [Bacteroidales bacterium]MBQ7018049.1 WbqC family protein [Bacteroidales bacterium]MBR2478462.1 WbqC family protein [Bacteroidales bacterium]
MIFGTSLLSTAYLPPIEYFVAIANSGRVEIECGEMYQKQSYRTRCHINGANGLLVLTLPVLRSAAKGEESSHKIPVAQLKIDYSKPWLLQHKRALEAAYMSSPFFEYYMDDLYAVLDSGEESLLAMNTRLVHTISELIGIQTPIVMSDGNFIAPGSDLLQERGISDFRDSIHPKKPALLMERLKMNKPYWQVFTNKQGFVPNLSVLDLLFNEGPNAISYLESL